MTQPVQEPSQGRTNQGLEYRTRQLFRRPAPPPTTPAGVNLPSAVASKSFASVSYSDPTDMIFGFLYTNDQTVFDAVGGNPSSFQYVKILQDGFYVADFSIEWAVNFDAGAGLVFIQPEAETGGSDSPLNAVGLEVLWIDSNNTWIGGAQSDAQEKTHHQITARAYFSFEASFLGSSDFGIGITLRVGGSGTKSMSSNLQVTRLGDILVQV